MREEGGKQLKSGKLSSCCAFAVIILHHLGWVPRVKPYEGMSDPPTSAGLSRISALGSGLFDLVICCEVVYQQPQQARNRKTARLAPKPSVEMGRKKTSAKTS